MDNFLDAKPVAVPKSRLSRLSKLGSLAGRVAGNMLVDGGKELAQGKRPVLRELLLTEKNLKQLADKLAKMRGAAMKAGQLLSMDAGNLLPDELAAILDRLRAEAVTMPAVQLHDVLESQWGDDWQDSFSHFSFNPIAAASIGQVHKATTREGLELAVKVQYPGVRESIDSDLDNVFSLLKISGLIPKEVDLTPLVDEARAQLKYEADYLREGEQMQLYAKHLQSFEQRDEILIPEYYPDLSTDQLLCMSFMQGRPLDTLNHASQEERNRVVSLMARLFFAEFLHYRTVQTDPNLANYLYHAEAKQLVLLDFGATRSFEQSFVMDYSAALKAAIAGDRQALLTALETLGFFDEGRARRNIDVVLDIFMLATEPMRFDGEYDFASSAMISEIRQRGMAASMDPDAWHTPPTDVLFLHRKLAGLYLIASKFKTQVNVKQIISQYL